LQCLARLDPLCLSSQLTPTYLMILCMCRIQVQGSCGGVPSMVRPRQWVTSCHGPVAESVNDLHSALLALTHSASLLSSPIYLMMLCMCLIQVQGSCGGVPSMVWPRQWGTSCHGPVAESVNDLHSALLALTHSAFLLS